MLVELLSLLLLLLLIFVLLLIATVDDAYDCASNKLASASIITINSSDVTETLENNELDGMIQELKGE